MNTSTEAPAGENSTSETQSDVSPNAATESQIDLSLIADVMTCVCATFGYEALRPNLEGRAATLRKAGKTQRSEVLEAFIKFADQAAPAVKSQVAAAGLRVVPAASAPLPSDEPASAPATEPPKYLLLRPFASENIFARAGSMITFDGVPNAYMEPLNPAAKARLTGVRR
jgi:hypothetical protein